MATLTPTPVMQFFDANGNPLVGGKLYTYASGTSTPLATYTDAGAGTLNANPIILNSRGEASIWLGASVYKFILNTPADTLIWSADGIAALATTGSVAAVAANLQAFITLMSSSAGAANVGFLPSGGNAVDTTGQAKLRERVSALDFDCDLTGTTTCTTTLQSAVDYSRSVGGNLWLNHGRYKTNGVVTVDYSTLTNVPTVQPYQINITGEGAGNTVFINALAANYALQVTGAAGIASHENTVLRDFSFGGIPTSNGMYVFDVAFTKLENIGFYGLNIGLKLTSVLSSEFENLYFYYCVVGVDLVPGGFSQINATEWNNCRWALCSSTAVAGGPATQINFNSCNVEGCGTHADAATGGINLTFTGAEGEVGASFDGCYFENNAGGWDVRIENTGTHSLTHTFKNCNFQRVSGSNFVTNNILAYCSGGGSNTLVFIGCTFSGYNDYVPDAGRLYVNLGTGTTAVCIGCSFDSTVEQGTLANLSADYSYTGTATGFTATLTGTVTYSRVGNIVTMTIPNFTGTSNATTLTITGGPASMRPAAQQRAVITVLDSGAASIGTATIETSGVITVWYGGGNYAFTNSGAKGILASSISYSVA